MTHEQLVHKHLEAMGKTIDSTDMFGFVKKVPASESCAKISEELAIEFAKHLCQIDAVLYSKDRLWIPDKDNSTNGFHTTIEEYYNDYSTPTDNINP